jgi:hypothetical protein
MVASSNSHTLPHHLTHDKMVCVFYSACIILFARRDLSRKMVLYVFHSDGFSLSFKVNYGMIITGLVRSRSICRYRILSAVDIGY